MDSIGKRVKAVREEMRIPQAELARLAGLKQPTISSLEAGKSAGSGHLASIADALGVSAIWLETGRGERGVDDHELNGKYAIQILPSQGSCGWSRRNSKTHRPDGEEIVMGRDWFKKYGLTPTRCFALYADGDSMAQFLVHGDLVVFKAVVGTLVSGSIYCIETPEGLRIKRYHKRIDGNAVLSTDNPDKSACPDEIYNEAQLAKLVFKGKFAFRAGGMPA